jgi:hypothetical protein
MRGANSGAGAATNPSVATATMSQARKEGKAFTPTTCTRDAVLAELATSPLLAKGDPSKPHFIEIELLDQKGHPIPHERFRVVAPNKKPFEGFLDDKGFARIDGIDPGTCDISFPDLDAGTWKPGAKG